MPPIDDLPPEVLHPIDCITSEVPPRVTVRLFVGPITTVAIDDKAPPRSLWVAMALNSVDGRAAGLGLYDEPPRDEHLLSLLDEAVVEPGPLGKVWSCACDAVETDRALLWSTPETTEWLSLRGIRLHGAVPPGPAADEEALKSFSRTVTSLSKALKRCRHSRDDDRRALLTPLAAMEAACAWRAACEAANAGG